MGEPTSDRTSARSDPAPGGGSLVLRPAQTDAVRALGFVYLRSGNFAKAQVLFAALCEVWPNDVQTLASLAYAQLQQGQFEAALSTLDKLGGGGVVPPLFQLLRARALAGLQRTEEARQALLAFSRARQGG